MSDSNYLNATQAAKILNISRAGLYKLVEKKRVPHTRIVGRILFKEDRLRAWAEEFRVDPVADPVND